MVCNFDQIIDREDSFSMKWQKYKNTDIIPMWVADMDFKVPDPILDALKERLAHPVFGYSVVPDSLNQSVAANLDRQYGWKIQKEWIIWTPGVVSAIHVACRAYGRPDDAIVTTVPVYPPFLAAPSNSGRPLITVPMIEIENRMTFDFNALEQAFSKNVSLFILCSPYNPCGTVFTKQELTTLVELCTKYRVLICSDEIHCDFILNEHKTHIPTAMVSDQAAAMTLTVMAPSKTYNIPGLSCSFVIVPDKELRTRFVMASKGSVPDVNIFGLVAARAAYDSCGDWLAQLIVYLRKNRDLVHRRINSLKGCSLNPIESTYLAWIDIRKTGIENPVAFFENAGVGLSDGAAFGQNGFVRLNFGCPESRLKQGLDRIEAALKQ